MQGAVPTTSRRTASNRDEIHTFDWLGPKDHFHKGKQGLSGKRISIILVDGQHKSMVAFFVGHGYPTSREIRSALLPHIAGGASARIVHDGLSSHRDAIRESGARDEVHEASGSDGASLRSMLLINSFSSWAKRYLDRFTGMDTEYLQDYLNWFVYSFRCKQQDEKMAKGGADA